MTELHVWCIDDGERHWIAARTADEAIAWHAQIELGYTDVARYREECHPTVTRLPDDQLLTVAFPDLDPPRARVQTARDWARELGRTGLVAATVY